MTNDKREALKILLMENASDVIDGVIEALAYAGANPRWDSGTIEGVLSQIEQVTGELGVPGVGNTGDEDEDLKYWCEVGGYDYEGEFEDEEPEPTTYTLHTQYIHMTNATVTRGKYHGGGVALVAEAEDEDGMLDRMTLSINLTAYPHLPDTGPDQVYVPDYNEHEGLADALVTAGIAKYVGTSEDDAKVTFGAFETTAYLMQISEEIQ